MLRRRQASKWDACPQEGEIARLFSLPRLMFGHGTLSPATTPVCCCIAGAAGIVQWRRLAATGRQLLDVCSLGRFLKRADPRLILHRLYPRLYGSALLLLIHPHPKARFTAIELRSRPEPQRNIGLPVTAVEAKGYRICRFMKEVLQYSSKIIVWISAVSHCSKHYSPNAVKPLSIPQLRKHPVNAIRRFASIFQEQDGISRQWRTSRSQRGHHQRETSALKSPSSHPRSKKVHFLN